MTAYEMRISDWSSDVCSSDLRFLPGISPAVIAGYGWSFAGGNQPSAGFMLGGSIAPYSPYKIYFQAEAYLGVHRNSTFGSFQDYVWDDRTGPERVPQFTRSEERRVGKECVRKCRSRG